MSKGNSFSGDCYREIPKTGKSFRDGDTSSHEAKNDTSARSASSRVLAFGRRAICTALHPILNDLDDTGSNKEFARIFRTKYPSLYGQIMYPGKTIAQIKEIEEGRAPMDVVPYLRSYEFILGYIGDADCDDYPLQYSDPSSGGALLPWIKEMNLEGGGGSGLHESFELGALRALRYVEWQAGAKPFYFLACDEKPYPRIYAGQVSRYLDRNFGQRDLSTKDVYAELFDRYEGRVFILLNPYQGWESKGRMNRPGTSDEVYRYWLDMVPDKYRKHVIRLLLEKSFIDVELGIIARWTGARDKAGYAADMRSKGQDEERVAKVNDMLSFLDDREVNLSEAPVASGERFDTGSRRV